MEAGGSRGRRHHGQRYRARFALNGWSVTLIDECRRRWRTLKTIRANLGDRPGRARSAEAVEETLRASAPQATRRRRPVPHRGGGGGGTRQ
jgi:hypothetical protein